MKERARPLLAALAICLTTTACGERSAESPAPGGPWHDDVSRLNRTEVGLIVRPRTVDEIQDALAIARGRDLPVSISGARHSQGGHVLYGDGHVQWVNTADQRKRLQWLSGGLPVEIWW